MSMLNFICSNSLIVLSTLIMYHPGHLQHFLDIRGARDTDIEFMNYTREEVIQYKLQEA